MIKAIFFDLDGTLLPLNEEQFMNLYFDGLYESVKDRNYQKDELIKAIWVGTLNMYKNDGSKLNEEVFWDTFYSLLKTAAKEDQIYFDKYYKTNFKDTIKACKENIYARQIIDFVHQNKLFCVLSTNPIFPKIATTTRMSYVNLNENDFDIITTYETSRYCKPNPQYFIDLLNKLNLKPNEVILFGNNDVEDYECALNAKIKCYLVDGNLILHKDKNLNPPIIKMDEVIATIKKEIALNK